MNLTDWTTLILSEAVRHRQLLGEAILIHLGISGIALGIAILTGIPLGLACSRFAALSQPVTATFNMTRVIPGLALLAFLIPIFGTGSLPAIVALVMLALPSVLLNTMSGFRQVGPLNLETAHGLGMDHWQSFCRVELPLALPYILTGLRIASIEVISGATLAAFIGGGGLGTLIINGLSTYNFPLLLIGALPVAALALMTDLCFNRLFKYATRYQRC